MGDFNAPPDANVIVNLKKEMNDARDISTEKPFGPSGTFNGFEFNKPVTLLIDYIFISKTPVLGLINMPCYPILMILNILRSICRYLYSLTL